MVSEKEPIKERSWNKHASAHGRIAIGQLLILLLLIAGVLFTLQLQIIRGDEVFFTGDGGVKALMVRQFAAGVWQADLQLKAEPWIRQLWDRGLYPFGPQFVYEIEGRHYIQYPLLFPALTAPLYDRFGFRGQTVLPLVGVWIVWAAFLLLCRRRGIESVGSAFGLAGLIFASTLTLYSAMFSEHTLAVALSFTGLVFALPPLGREPAKRDLLIAGLLLGSSVWLRPESGIFVIGAMAALWWIGVRVRYLVRLGIAAIVPVVLCIGMNQWFFGKPLGLHGVQAVDPNQMHYSDMPPFEIAVRLFNSLVHHHPIIMALAGIALIGLLARGISDKLGGAPDRNEISAWICMIVLCLGSVFILPNDGGKQFGARYWFHLIPLIWFVAAIRFAALRAAKGQAARVIMAAMAALLVIGIWLNTVEGQRVLNADYRKRTLPALRLVRHMGNGKVDVVAVSHQWISQELQAGLDSIPFVRVQSETDLKRLVRGMADANRSRLLWFDFRPISMAPRLYGDLKLQFGPSKRIGQYFVSLGLVSSTGNTAGHTKAGPNKTMTVETKSNTRKP